MSVRYLRLVTGVSLAGSMFWNTIALNVKCIDADVVDMQSSIEAEIRCGLWCARWWVGTDGSEIG